MSARTKAEALLGVALVALAALLGSAWRGARDDAAKLKSTLAQQNAVVVQAQSEIARLQADDAARERQSAAKIAALEKAAGAQKTPAQIAQWIPQQLPVPVPFRIGIPPSTPANPAPMAIAQIPQSDLGALRDQIEKCQECAVKLASSEADVASRDQQLKLAGEQLSAMTRERDAAVKAAKGGGFFARLRRGAKWFVIGAGAGAATVCASGHCK